MIHAHYITETRAGGPMIVRGGGPLPRTTPAADLSGGPRTADARQLLISRLNGSVANGARGADIPADGVRRMTPSSADCVSSRVALATRVSNNAAARLLDDYPEVLSRSLIMRV